MEHCPIGIHFENQTWDAQVLDDMLKLGYIRKRCFTPVFHAFDGEVGAEMEKLITHLTNLRRSMVTIKDYRLYLSEFLMHLNERNVKHVSAITEKDILSFVSSHPTNKVNIVSALRVLFRFWREEHIVDDCFEELFDTYKTHKPECIPSYFAANEVMRIEQSVSRNSANGKRNYAMLLLASRLGLRASDIADLQFSDIDWDKNMITLTMQKTKKVIELPLLADVSNAFIDYLRHECSLSSHVPVDVLCHENGRLKRIRLPPMVNNSQCPFGTCNG